jgi:hypothetical protein
VYGKFPKACIDHVSGDKLDNRICNLRDSNKRENSLNRNSHRSGRLFGCYFSNQAKKWQSRMRISGKSQHLGFFDTEIEAHKAYCEKHKDLFGRDPLESII